MTAVYDVSPGASDPENLSPPCDHSRVDCGQHNSRRVSAVRYCDSPPVDSDPGLPPLHVGRLACDQRERMVSPATPLQSERESPPLSSDTKAVSSL